MINHQLVLCCLRAGGQYCKHVIRDANHHLQPTLSQCTHCPFISIKQLHLLKPIVLEHPNHTVSGGRGWPACVP
ncbi:hypothetical protein OPV22_012947 [Ensete ventricosum]|uniref:Uncharacterized protein n=1 Tax=Ensete ventricosum TaxID=4639 RepID=A0AAV8R2S1_ENSVE|nr:hypothetical protein OPV22_012947 [Ensete ventricosum]